MTTFLGVVTCVCFVASAYSFTLYPLSLLVLRNISKRKDKITLNPAPPDRLSFSIVLCAYNEEKSIGEKLRNLSRVTSMYPGFSEVRIYLDSCSDRTAEIVKNGSEAFGSATPLTIIEGVRRSGKSHGMNRLLEGTNTDIVLFTDANVGLDENCLFAAAQAFRDPSLGCICGNLKYVNEGDSATAEMGTLYWRWEEWLKQLESDTGSTVGADGSLFAIRRQLFRPVPDDIIDDMYTSMGVLLQGYRVARDENFRAYEKHTVSSSDEFRRKVRIACRSVNCYRLLRPNFRNLSLLDRYKLYAHKALRWTTILWLCLGTLSLILFLVLQKAYLALLGLVAITALLSLAATLGIGPFAKLAEIFRAFIATGLGVVDSFRGRRYQTWGIAASSRAP